jgi:hypothetical protein
MRRAPLVALWLACLACGRDSGAPAPINLSFVWVEPGASVDRETARRVEAAGYSHWVLDASPGAAATTAPARSGVALAIDPDAAPGDLAATLGVARLAAEARGLVPEIAHLELERLPSDGGDRLGVLAAELRRRHGFRTVSLGLPANTLADPRAANVAAHADLVVATVYGQRPGDRDDAAAYDASAAMGRAAQLAALGRPYQPRFDVLGVVTSGAGAVTRTSLAALLRDPRLKLDPGFSLTGVDRALYRFVPARSGRGEAAVVRMPLAGVVADLRARIAAHSEPRLRGFGWRRLAAADEALSLPLTALERSAGRATAPPALAPRVEWIDERGGRRLRAVLENRSEEGSAIVSLDGNYVELIGRGGVFGAVATGDFQRYEFRRHGEERVTVQAMRRPERILLFLPALAPGETVRSGAVEWRPEANDARVAIEARFLFPGGVEVRATGQ